MADNPGQPGPNLTGKDGHNDRNKVAGEGATNTSQTSTGSSPGGAGASREGEDVDARPYLDLSDDPRGGPSMSANLDRQDRERPIEGSSFAPGGDKVSQPGVREDDLADPSGEDAQRPSTFHDAQPRPEAER